MGQLAELSKPNNHMRATTVGAFILPSGIEILDGRSLTPKYPPRPAIARSRLEGLIGTAQRQQGRKETIGLQRERGPNARAMAGGWT